MERRTFLKLSGMLPLTCYLPNAFAQTSKKNVLVLVELNGGNDGLNTVVPFKQSAYYAKRPRLAVEKKSVLKLDSEVGFAPSLKPLIGTWNDGELAVVQGLGYDKPNRSHFRSIEIWEAATDADAYAPTGWVEGLLNSDNPVNSLVLGRDEAGPLIGTNPLHFSNRGDVSKVARGMEKLSVKTKNAALQHVVEVQNEALDALSIVSSALADKKKVGKFQKNAFSQQMEVAAQLIAADIDVRVIKVSIGSFDTHVNQKRVHENLLKIMAEGIAEFRAAMKKVGRWDDVVVATYSEFGRRVKENGGQGTDHGTAAPHLVMGGRIKGGLFGKQPDLSDLQNGDLKHHVDFRSYYRDLSTATFGQIPKRLKGFTSVGFS